MRVVPFFIIIFVSFVGCATYNAPNKGAASTAETQAKLSPDPVQAKLWREAAKSGAVGGIETVFLEGPVVKDRKKVWVADKPVQSTRMKFPATVVSGVRILAAPEIEEEFKGTVQVQSVEGEFIALDLGKGRTLNLQIKVRGGRVRAREGEMAKLLFRQGEPFRRNDLVAVKLSEDDLVYALVGGREPVHLNVTTHSLNAKQVGKSERNSMNVQVIIGGESRILRSGEQVDFKQSRLTVKILASVAVIGESAHVLPGQPFRLELLGWRTADH